MYANAQKHFEKELQEIRDAGLWKEERVILSPQGVTVRVGDGQPEIVVRAQVQHGLAVADAYGHALRREDDAFGLVGAGIADLPQAVGQVLLEFGVHANGR